MIIALHNFLSHVALQRMLPYWKKQGHSTVNVYDKSDVQLSNVIIYLKTDVPKVHRLNGIYYGLDMDYKKRNLELSYAHTFADALIYQSHYSKVIIHQYLKPRKEGAIYDVIYNGIEPNWCGDLIEHDGINITVTSLWRRFKRLKEIIELFIEYNKIYPNSKLHIFGPLYDNKKVEHKDIIYYGMTNLNQTIPVLRKTDFSLHLTKRDSCPNSVVEFLGAGIPVITTDTCGGTTEICSLNKGNIIVKGDGDWLDTEPVMQYGDEWNVLSKELKDKLLSAMVEMTENKRKIVLPEQLTAEYMANKYIEILSKAKNI